MLKHPKIGDDLPNLSASVHQVATIHHAAGHVFAMTRIALHHHGSWLEDRHGDLCHRELLMIGLLLDQFDHFPRKVIPPILRVKKNSSHWGVKFGVLAASSR